MADKHPRTPVKVSPRPGSAPLPRPGLHTAYTRVSNGSASCFCKNIIWLVRIGGENRGTLYDFGTVAL